MVTTALPETRPAPAVSPPLAAPELESTPTGPLTGELPLNRLALGFAHLGTDFVERFC